jgi:hypothetical protein
VETVALLAGWDVLPAETEVGCRPTPAGGGLGAVSAEAGTADRTKKSAPKAAVADLVLSILFLRFSG